MRGLQIFFLAAMAVSIGGASAGAADPSDVGSMERVTLNAYGTPPQASRRPMHPGDRVAFKELLETLVNSGALVRFVDGSKLTIGAKSSILVDEFVFDPAEGSGHALISISAGALRFATGSMPKGGTVIDTPTATMTLRGTVVRVGVGLNGDTTLIVDEGEVGVHDKQQNTDQTVGEGSSVSVGQGGSQGPGNEIGDPLVDGGYDTAGGNSGVEQRRQNQGGTSNSSSSGSSSGHSSGGYSTQ
jgi:hypothetical protein